MNWEVVYLPEAEKDLSKLDNSVRLQVLKGIQKVQTNPLPKQQGGYGTPLGNKNGTNLTSFMKIKFRGLGVRVVYRLEFSKTEMKIIVISAREDNEAYREAARRIEKDLLGTE